MVSVLAAMLFTGAFAASVWAIYITVQPRLAYMRYLLTGDTTSALAPAVAPRMRGVMRPKAVSTMPRSIRAAA